MDKGRIKMGKIWDWHKRNWNKPVFGIRHFNDGQGNKETKMFLFGSHFHYKEQVDFDEEPELIETKKPKLLR